MRRIKAAFIIGCIALVGCSNVEETRVAGDGHTDHVYPNTPAETPIPLKSAEYPGAIYRQARFYTRGRSRAIDTIVIHTTEGRYNGAISWFRDPNNQYKTSAHYVIQSSDGEITQMVKESDTAHHVRNYNSRSIGIEHEAFIAQSSWYTDAMYRSSASLVRYLCEKHNIPMDREHIRGHNELDPARRDDPGRHWDWSKFMGLVRNGAPNAAPPVSNPGGSVENDCRFRFWNCTMDRTARVRCEDGRVAEQQPCPTGCQVMQVGTDDVCRPQANDGQSWGACTAAGVPGTCMSVGNCSGESTPGLCPGNNDVQCCTEAPAEPPPRAVPVDEPVSTAGAACRVDGAQGVCFDLANAGGCQSGLVWSETCGDFGACCVANAPPPAEDPPVNNPPADNPPADDPPADDPPRAVVVPEDCTINGDRGECLPWGEAEQTCPWQNGAELWETPECGNAHLCCVMPTGNNNPPDDPPPVDDVWSNAVECDVNGDAGLCVPTAACSGDGGQSTPGHCPGGNDIQCCTW
jgi:hypothetical protein